MAELVTKYQQYAEYKESGVEWLGEIPSHWQTKPLKHLCTYNDEVLSDSTSKELELEYVDIGSVSSTEGITSTENMLFKNAPSRARRIVQDGDVIISTVRTYLEAIAPVNNPPVNMIVSTGFAVIRPNDHLFKGYAAYCLRAKGFIKEVVSLSVGVSYPAINATDLVGIKIPSLPFKEQAKIANFLDHETAQIDTLIDKQYTLIQLLREKRQAVISHAVTKGLNPNAPMKDSGVEWLGEVPEHWDVMKLKRLVQFSQGVQVDLGLQKHDRFNGSLKFLRIENYTQRSSDFRFIYPQLAQGKLVNKDDVVMVRYGASAGYIGRGLDGVLANNLFKITPFNQLITHDFLSYFLNNSYRYLQKEMSGSAMPAISFSMVGDIFVALPSRNEQIEIVKWVELQLAKLNSLEEKAKQAIQLMQERRTALISAAVTGKIDVRGWRAAE